MTGALHERYFIDLVDDPIPDAPIAFRTLHEAIEWVKGYMRSAEEVTTDRRKRAARHGIAISRRGRLMALVRPGPDDGPKVTIFA